MKEYRIFNARCKMWHQYWLIIYEYAELRGKRSLIFAAGPCLDLPVFVLAHALFCERTPVEACWAEYTGIYISTGFALCFGLIAPYLNSRTAGTAFYIFRFWLLYVFTARAFILEHNNLSSLFLYYYIKYFKYMILVINMYI